MISAPLNRLAPLAAPVARLWALKKMSGVGWLGAAAIALPAWLLSIMLRTPRPLQPERPTGWRNAICPP